MLLWALLLASVAATLASVFWTLSGALARAPRSHLSLQVRARIDHSPDLLSLRLAATGWRRFWFLPGFAAGQSIALQFPDAALKRRYSLARWQRWPFRYELTIKKEPQGQFTSRLFEQIRVGDRLHASLPGGEFHWPEHLPDCAVMIAGGVGVTPLLAMLDEWLTRARADQQLHFFWQVRHEAEWIYSQVLLNAARTHEGVRIHCLASRPRACAPRRLDLEMLRCFVPTFSSADFYLCASSRLLDDLIAQLRQAGVADAQIHYECFAGLAALDAGQWPVQIGARQLQFDGHAHLLDLLEREQLAPDSDCRNGSCGRCRVRVLDGQVRLLLKPEFDAPQGEVLACCAVPESALRLAPL